MPLAITDGMIGVQFGRWTVVSAVSNRDQHGFVLWQCRCICGVERVVTGHSLRNGSSRSCGCLRDDRARKPKLPNNLGGLRRLIGNYKRAAYKRNISWELTEEEVRDLISQQCIYCGTPPTQVQTLGRQTKPWMDLLVYNGIDRLDNNRGYIWSNCVPCCKRCNRAKGEMSYLDFIGHIKAILLNLGESL